MEENKMNQTETVGDAEKKIQDVKDHVNPLKSLSFKMVIIFFALILAVVGVSIFISSRTARKTTEDIYTNYTKNVAEATAEGLNGLFSGGEKGRTATEIARNENEVIAKLAADPENADVKKEMGEYFSGVLGNVKLEYVFVLLQPDNRLF